MNKSCVECNEVYPEESYAWNRSGKSRKSKCSNCIAKYNRERTAKHRAAKRGPDWVPKVSAQQACTPEGHTCKYCNNMKLCSEYFYNNSFKYGHESVCKECKAAKRREKVVTPVSSALAKYRYSKDQIATWKRRYNITEQQYRWLSQDQLDRCAMCLGKEKDNKALAVDHDHRCCPGRVSCGVCVRGLLCGDCNMLLGKLEANPRLFSFFLLENHEYVNRRPYYYNIPWQWSGNPADLTP